MRCSWLIFGITALATLSCAGQQRSKGGLEPMAGVSFEEIDQALAPKRLALVVGINSFSDERWPALKHASSDARELGEVLQDKERGRFDQVDVLADPAGVEKEQVLRALERLAQSNSNEEDTVLIYFSTHGTLGRGPKGDLKRYLVASSTDQDRLQQSAIGVHKLMDRFEALPSKRKVIILASCHSGAGKSALPKPVQKELKGIKGAFFVKPLSETSQASMVLTACGWGETASEDDKLKHDIYTSFLLDALAGEDSDGDGAVTATEAHAYAMARTYYYSQGRQRPQVESRVSGADPIVLTGTRRRTGDPVLFSFLPRMTGLKVLVDGRSKGSLPGRMVIEPGSHRVVICEPESCDENSEPLVDAQVDFEPGEHLAVESLLDSGELNWNLSFRAGYQRFFDPYVRSEFIAPLPVFSFCLSRQGFPVEYMETGLDITLAGNAQSMNTAGEMKIEQDLVQMSYGLQMLLRLDLGDFRLLLGPRVAGVHNMRLGFNPDGSNQHVANFSPGLVAQFRYQFPWGLSLDLYARAHYLSINTQGDDLSTGFVDLMGGLGWSY